MNNVTVISTGNELVNGTTLDTNSSYISYRLFATSFRVRSHIVVNDRIDDLVATIEYAIRDSDFIFITGGLGPTDDDNTISALQKIAGFNIHQHDGAREKLHKAFKSFGREVNSEDYRMITVPDGSLVFENSVGLAPGFLISHNDCSIIAMPGVPGEMMKMLDNEIIPYLNENSGITPGSHFTFQTTGMKETDVNRKIELLYMNSDTTEWGITAKEGVITVTIIDRGRTLDIISIKKRVRELFGSDLLDFQFTNPEEELVHLLRKHNLSIAVAESCTGGMIAKRLTDVPGSSDVFLGGVTAYSNRVKTVLLNVAEKTIVSKGAVSEEVAGEMAMNIKVACNSSFGISVSGIAGPGGGNENKPVGTVCFGFALDRGLVTKTKQYSGSRNRIRNFSSLYVINFLRRYILNSD